MQNQEIFKDIFTQFGGIYQKKDKKIFQDIFNQIAGTTDEITQDNENIYEINILLVIVFNAFTNLDVDHYNKNDSDDVYLNTLFPAILNKKFDLQLLENIDFSKNDEEIQKQFIKIALCKYEKKKINELDTVLLTENINNIYNEIIINYTDFADMKNKIFFIKISFNFIKNFCNIISTTIDYEKIISNYLRKYYTKHLSSTQFRDPYLLNIHQTDDDYQKKIDKLKSDINQEKDTLNDQSVNNNKKLSYNNNVEALLTIFLLIHCICFDKIIFIVERYNKKLKKTELDTNEDLLSDLTEFVKSNFNDNDSVKKIIEKEIKRDEEILKILRSKIEN